MNPYVHEIGIGSDCPSPDSGQGISSVNVHLVIRTALSFLFLEFNCQGQDLSPHIHLAPFVV